MVETSLFGKNGLSFFSYCHHVNNYYSENESIFFCCAGSVFFVGALYLLVPKHIRILDRDDPIHIQWRSVVTCLVCLVACITYPFVFCDTSSTEEKEEEEEAVKTFSILSILIHPSISVLGVLFHTIVLYTGPIVVRLVYLYESQNQKRQKDGRFLDYLKQVYMRLIIPTLISFFKGPYVSSKNERWKNIRNFIVAPATEEIFFRGCFVPCLLSSGMSPIKTTFVAPIFFGFAHVHHAMVRLSKGERFFPVFLITFFQFTYTSLFGSYASYAFIRSGSILAVIISHSYCNWMGLPDLSFMNKRHYLHKYRMVLLLSYIIGIYGFIYFFSNDYLLPLPLVLPQIIQS